MMNQQPFNAQMAAAVLRGLAGEFRSIQAIDPNEAGFVVRIRALEIRAAEQTIAALNAGAFNGQPWELRFRELASTYNAAVESQALPREQRVLLLRDFWWDMTGYCRAKCEGVVVGGKPRLGRVIEIGPPPAIQSPYAEPELARLGLERPAEFAAEAGRSARLHAAFVCSTMADILAAVKDPPPDDTAGDSSGETSHVDAHYTERIKKQHWAVLLRISVKEIRRRLDDGRLRAHPETAKSDQYLRLHIDDLPKELKQRHDRKTAVEKLKQTTKRQ